jgi:ABC-type transport system involved in cytochrome c biogenesis permease subunit
MAAMTGHLYLLKPSDALRHLLMPITLFALLFTAVGTLLGGIWADQSWGRFWGWDPKENGALLIVLWLIWIIHGRISHHFTLTGFAAALGLTNIMVALTWFGVNLLGVGLHSYGFISGVAYGLIAFCTAQTIIIFGLYWRRRMLDA